MSKEVTLPRDLRLKVLDNIIANYTASHRDPSKEIHADKEDYGSYLGYGSSLHQYETIEDQNWSAIDEIHSEDSSPTEFFNPSLGAKTTNRKKGDYKKGSPFLDYKKALLKLSKKENEKLKEKYGEKEMPYEYKDSISQRQYQTDKKRLAEMAEQDEVTIEYDSYYKKYYYLKKRDSEATNSYSVFGGLRFDAEEYNQVSLALSVIQSIQGLKPSSTLDKVIKKLSDELGFNRSNFSDIIKFDFAELTGINHLHALLKFTSEKKVITLYYKPFDQPLEKHIIHPYFLKEYNNRWFLFALSEEQQDVYNYPIDRIKRYQSNEEITFNEAQRPDPDKFLQNQIGVSKYGDRPLQDIILRFNRRDGLYVIHKKLHQSQVELSVGMKYILIKITVRYNFELQQRINFFGTNVKWLNEEEVKKASGI